MGASPVKTYGKIDRMVSLSLTLLYKWGSGCWFTLTFQSYLSLPRIEPQ